MYKIRRETAAAIILQKYSRRLLLQRSRLHDGGYPAVTLPTAALLHLMHSWRCLRPRIRHLRGGQHHAFFPWPCLTSSSLTMPMFSYVKAVLHRLVGCRLQEKLTNLENENHVLRQKTFSITPKPPPEKFPNLIGLTNSDLKRPFVRFLLIQVGYLQCFVLFSNCLKLSNVKLLESPTPTKYLSPIQHSTGSRRARLPVERHEGNHEILLSCIKENLGFKDGKPVAACIIYRCLLHWRAFESERTAIFDHVIEAINDVLKAKEAAGRLPYWLSNTSALLCLLQKNLRSNGFFGTPSRRSAGGLGGKLAQLAGRGDIARVDARYPAILFKQQLTTCVEKIFGQLRDNLKKEISPLLSLCIQAPKSTRPGKTPKAPGVGAQQPSNSHWDNIVSFLNFLMDTLRENHVPSFFICKLMTQLFSFVNIQLFNSMTDA